MATVTTPGPVSSGYEATPPVSSSDLSGFRELKTVQKIRDCLDVVEIVMRFLASGGQKADDRLDNYL